MCDCYHQKCEHEGCEKTIPVHIGDCRYPRKDVRAWCGDHIPKEQTFGMGFADGVEISVTVEDSEIAKRGTFFGLMLKDGALRPSDEDVSINSAVTAELAAFRTPEKGNQVREIIASIKNSTESKP
jgi:hypothetical protein